jgi:hypothetical protein
VEESVTEANEQPNPDLHPLYVVATSDSVMTVRFVGNTAVVASIEFSGAPGVDPYQMLAAARDLERRAFQMLQMAEIEEAKRREEERKRTEIATATHIPSGGQFKQS